MCGHVYRSLRPIEFPGEVHLLSSPPPVSVASPPPPMSAPLPDSLSDDDFEDAASGPPPMSPPLNYSLSDDDFENVLSDGDLSDEELYHKKRMMQLPISEDPENDSLDDLLDDFDSLQQRPPPPPQVPFSPPKVVNPPLSSRHSSPSAIVSQIQNVHNGRHSIHSDIALFMREKQDRNYDMAMRLRAKIFEASTVELKNAVECRIFKLKRHWNDLLTGHVISRFEKWFQEAVSDLQQKKDPIIYSHPEIEGMGEAGDPDVEDHKDAARMFTGLLVSCVCCAFHYQDPWVYKTKEHLVAVWELFRP